MKLFAQYNRLNIFATVVIFLVGSCTFYVLLRYILIRQMDTSLQSEQQEIVQYVHLHHTLPEIINTREQRESFVIDTASKYTCEFFNSIEAGTGKEYRDIRFSIAVGADNYIIVVSKPMDSTQLLLKLIIGVTVVMIALILVAGIFINRRILNGLWKPFYETVNQVKDYNVTTQQAISLPVTQTDEFALLNQSLGVMIERVQNDYESLKRFTGHAAHEIQTPLAVIRTQLDMLMQQENLLQRYAPGISEIEQAVQRLSRLNQSLLLLTKVENRQFVLDEDVHIERIIADKCTELTEIMQVKHIALSLTVAPFTVHFHKHLAEIVVSNLINNAIRYNRPSGLVNIVLENGILSISNTSSLPFLDQDHVFQRFYRHADVKTEGNGLGLSIVKQICDFAGFRASYHYLDDMHIFMVDFNTRTSL